MSFSSQYYDLKYRLKYFHHINTDELDSRIAEIKDKSTYQVDSSHLFEDLFFTVYDLFPPHLSKLSTWLNSHYYNHANFEQLITLALLQHSFHHSFVSLLDIKYEISKKDSITEIGSRDEILKLTGFFGDDNSPFEKFFPAGSVRQNWHEYLKRYNKSENANKYSHHFIKKYATQVSICDDVTVYSLKTEPENTDKKKSDYAKNYAHNWVSFLMSNASISSLDTYLAHENYTPKTYDILCTHYENAYKDAIRLSNVYTNKAHTLLFNYFIEEYFSANLLHIVKLTLFDDDSDARNWKQLPNLDEITNLVFSLPPFLRDVVFQLLISNYTNYNVLTPGVLDDNAYMQPIYTESQTAPNDADTKDSLHIMHVLKALHQYLIPLVNDLFFYAICTFYDVKHYYDHSSNKIINLLDYILDDYQKYINFSCKSNSPNSKRNNTTKLIYPNYELMSCYNFFHSKDIGNCHISAIFTHELITSDFTFYNLICNQHATRLNIMAMLNNYIKKTTRNLEQIENYLQKEFSSYSSLLLEIRDLFSCEDSYDEICKKMLLKLNLIIELNGILLNIEHPDSMQTYYDLKLYIYTILELADLTSYYHYELPKSANTPTDIATRFKHNISIYKEFDYFMKFKTEIPSAITNSTTSNIDYANIFARDVLFEKFRNHRIKNKKLCDSSFNLRYFFDAIKPKNSTEKVNYIDQICKLGSHLTTFDDQLADKSFTAFEVNRINSIIGLIQ